MTRTLALFMDAEALRKSTLASRTHRCNPYLKLQGLLTATTPTNSTTGNNTNSGGGNNHSNIHNNNRSIQYLLPAYLVMQSPEPTTVVHLDSMTVYRTETDGRAYQRAVLERTDCAEWLKYLGCPAGVIQQQQADMAAVSRPTWYVL